MENKPLTEQINDVKQSVDASNEALEALALKVDALLQKESKPNAPATQPRRVNNQNVLHSFIRKSTKFWKWFGTPGEFKKHKTIVCFIGFAYILIAILALVFTSIASGGFSYISIFEILALLFGLALFFSCLMSSSLIEDKKLKRINIQKSDVSPFGLHYSTNKRKIYPRIFLYTTLIASAVNFVYVLVEKGNSFGAAATFEILLFVLSIGFYIASISLFAQYCIALYQGINSKGEKVILVHDPTVKNVVTLEEYKKKMPIF